MQYEKLLKISFRDEDKYKETYYNRINNECTTLLNFNINENQAFYLTNQEILLLITKIMSIDKQLNDKTARLPKIALSQFTKQALINEIKQTNDIENVYSTKKEIKETLIKINKKEHKSRFKGLISQYIKFQTNEIINLNTCEDIRKLYDEIVLDEVMADDKDNKPDGVIFRKNPVNIHSAGGKIIHEGLYPEDKIINSMSNALMILNNDEINYLVSAAIFHYLFAYIHPFYDGNGRTDRFISSYVISKNLNHLVAYKFSYTIKKHHSQYYKMFSETNDPRNKGDITPFIIQFLELILEAEKELVDDIDQRIESLTFFKTKMQKLNLSTDENKVLYVLLQNALFDDEGLSVGQLQEIVNKTYNTIIKILAGLNDLKLLRCTTSGKRKLYDVDLNALAQIE